MLKPCMILIFLIACGLCGFLLSFSHNPVIGVQPPPMTVFQTTQPSTGSSGIDHPSFINGRTSHHLKGHSAALSTEHQATHHRKRVFHHPISLIAQLKQNPHAGEKIFKSYCQSCHADPPEISIQAPRIGDHRAWRGLHALGIKKLLDMTIHGHAAMPARGGCFECSDQLLTQTIRYILNHSLQKRSKSSHVC